MHPTVLFVLFLPNNSTSQGRPLGHQRVKSNYLKDYSVNLLHPLGIVWICLLEYAAVIEERIVHLASTSTSFGLQTLPAVSNLCQFLMQMSGKNSQLLHRAAYCRCPVIPHYVDGEEKHMMM